jgi:hypothetical protein
MDNSRYLINEDPIFFLPTLAVGIGLNEAILLQKIHGWLQCTPKEHVGRNWIYNSYKSWHEQLPFMSEITIKRAVKNLIDKKIIITENFNKNSFDKTLWYSIDYEKLNEIVEISDSIKMIPSRVSDCDYREYQNDTTNTNNNYNNNNNNKKRENIEKLYFENNKVNDIFLEFLDLRKKIKAVNSDRAINTLINKLNKYDDDTKFMMIEQSIVNSWKDVYELKNKQSKKEDDNIEWF